MHKLIVHNENKIKSKNKNIKVTKNKKISEIRRSKICIHFHLVVVTRLAVGVMR